MEYIFVYGQFRDSGRKLLGADALFCGRAWIRGKLYKVNDFYPGYIPDIQSGIESFKFFKINSDNTIETFIETFYKTNKGKITNSEGITVADFSVPVGHQILITGLMIQ